MDGGGAKDCQDWLGTCRPPSHLGSATFTRYYYIFQADGLSAVLAVEIKRKIDHDINVLETRPMFALMANYL